MKRDMIGDQRIWIMRETGLETMDNEDTGEETVSGDRIEETRGQIFSLGSVWIDIRDAASQTIKL